MEFAQRSPTVRLLLALSLTTLLTGQSNPERASPVNLLVNLNVTAVDGSGQPVADLRPEDFQILDNGKPQKIVWFHAISRKGLQAARTDEQQKAPPYSNRGIAAPPAIFILFDLFNADQAARGLSANEITHALERFESPGGVYLYLLTPAAKLFVVHGVASEDAAWTRRIKPLMDEALRQVSGLKGIEDRYPQLRIGPTWQALDGVLSQIGEVPGPKSFLWITQGVENGFLVPGRQLFIDTAPLRQFAANLSALDTVAYSVQQRPSGSIAVASEGTPRDTLDQLSALTGGKVFPTDTTEDALRQAGINTERMNYRMAFSPERLDGKFHKIRVMAARKDVKIQTAERYYAIAAPDAGPREEAIENMIGQSPFEYPAIGLTAAAAPVAGTPGEFHLSIQLDAADVALLKEGARYKADVATALVELAEWTEDRFARHAGPSRPERGRLREGAAGRDPDQLAGEDGPVDPADPRDRMGPQLKPGGYGDFPAESKPVRAARCSLNFAVSPIISPLGATVAAFLSFTLRVAGVWNHLRASRPEVLFRPSRPPPHPRAWPTIRVELQGSVRGWWPYHPWIVLSPN